jgi:Fic family protein
VRNLYKYTPIYADGAAPELIEGDKFRTIVPIRSTVDEINYRPKMADNLIGNLTAAEKEFFEVLCRVFTENEWIDTNTAQKVSGKSRTTVKRYLRKFVDLSILEPSGANRNRQYRLPQGK